MSNVLNQRKLMPITAKVVRLAGDCHSLVYVTGYHSGEQGGRPPHQLCGEERGLHASGCALGAYEAPG